MSFNGALNTIARAGYERDRNRRTDDHMADREVRPGEGRIVGLLLPAYHGHPGDRPEEA